MDRWSRRSLFITVTPRKRFPIPEGEEEDTIVGVGNYLTSLLSEKYGYQVIHIKEAFDMMSGELDRNKAYNYACDYVEKVLEENPSVEVVIDLHRDGIDEDRRLVTEINGKDTAQILFYNGLSYTNDQGKVSYLPNPYIQDNLAFLSAGISGGVVLS